jgi:hydrogenase maturation protein HypF
LQALLRMLSRPRLCARTSSLGRLFDAVAALCGLPPVISFEGHAAMALEFAADPACDESYPLPLSDAAPAMADWEPMLRAVLADRAAGVPVGRISARFHNALADLALAIARRWGGAGIVLSGGCFQNATLSRRVRKRLLAAGLRVYSHRLVPPNDGGIALGQAVVAARIGIGD